MKNFLTCVQDHLFCRTALAGFLVAAAVLVGTTNGFAATTNLADCSQNTVQSAMSSASSGDVLVCPAGSWSWSNLNITKNVTIQGAGIGETTITLTSCGGLQSSTSYSGAFRVTGFSFTSSHNTCGYNSTLGWVRVLGNKNFRIDHNEFRMYAGTTATSHSMAIYTRYDVAGLIDHNTFINHPDEMTSGGSLGGVWAEGDGRSAWSLPLGQIEGEAHTLFVEDNYFRQATDSNGDGEAILGQTGVNYVFRHNEVRNLKCADAHGYEATYGTKEYDINNNQCIVEPGFSIYRAFYIRGGTGVIYNNTLSGNFTYGIALAITRATSDSKSPGRSELYGGIPARTACSSAEHYPCADQIGRGQSTGSSPNMTQVLSPLYIWGNDLSAASTQLTSETSSTYIQANRDYYYNQGAKPGFTEYTYPDPLTGQEAPPPATSGTPNPPSQLQVQ